MFIELTQNNGVKFLANVHRIDRVIPEQKIDGCYISGLTNNGGVNVKESYEEVLSAITWVTRKAIARCTK